MDLGLRDNVILVAGGHGFIGRAVVSRLRDEGAIVVPASRHAPDGLVMDAADDESVASAVETVLEAHGRLHALVVTAAPPAGQLDPARSADPDEVLAAVEGKALTFLRLANAALPRMRAAGYGRIVGVSGQNALLTGSIAGSVRNAALNIAAKNLADSAAGSGVTINTVNPGAVLTDPAPEVEPGRPGASSPADIAALIAFLASPLAGAISGEAIAVGHRVRGITNL